MDISTITDIRELKSMLADEFNNREVAIQTQNQANANINTINQRINQLKPPTEPEVPEPEQ